MTSNQAIELAENRSSQEQSSDVQVQDGLTEDGRPSYLGLKREKVVAGDLNLMEARLLLEAADRGLTALATSLPFNVGGVTDPCYGAYCSARLGYMACGNLERMLALELKKGELTETDEREIVRRIWAANNELGVLPVNTIIRAAEAEFLVSQGGEKRRQAEMARNHRLRDLGFWPGLGGIIVGFTKQDGTYVEFPFVDNKLSEKERWRDVEERAGKLGFVFDQRGRVSGFTLDDGRQIIISEGDRREQARTR